MDGSDDSGVDQPVKRPKSDLATYIKADTVLESLQPEQITTIFRRFDKSMLDSIESYFSHKLQDDYVELQARLMEAQRPIIDRLIRTRRTSITPAHRSVIKLAQVLHDLALCPEIPLPTKDAIRYYETTCIAFTAFSQHGAQCDNIIRDIANGAEPVEYFRTSVEASEKHLKSSTKFNNDQSSVIESTDKRLPAFQSAPVTISASTNTDHSPFSDEYLKDKVSSFIVNKEDLAFAIPWDRADDCDSGLKRLLAKSLFALQSGRWEFRRTPNGILLHGDQGTGKTVFVESFAAHHNLTMFKVSPAIHGSLRGQSEKLIQYVFEAIRAAAEQKPCVLFIDEADGLLGSSSGALSTFEGMLKQLWGSMINGKVGCFVFGATNKPWDINMADYNRRFSTKVHMTGPGNEAREMILKTCLQHFWHELTDADLKEVATITKGYSRFDIAQNIEMIAQELFFETSEADKWVSIPKDGKDVFIPAVEGDENITHGSRNRLENTEPRPISKDYIIQWFLQGKVQKTSSSELDQRHREWNENWSR